MQSNRSGFTLLELLIVLSLMAVLFGFAVGHARDAGDQGSLLSETHKIEEAIREAQKFAQSGFNPNSCDEYSGAYTFSWTENSYTVAPENCDPLSSYTLPNSIMIETESSTILFLSLGRGLVTPQSLVLKNVRSLQCTQIDISETAITKSDAVTCPQ